MAPVTMGTLCIGSYESEDGATSHSRPVYCNMTALRPRTIVSACESSSLRPWTTSASRLMPRMYRYVHDIRQLVVVLAATTAFWLTWVKQFEVGNDCFVTFVMFVANHLTEEAATDRHSFFCFFLLRPPKALPALFGAPGASELPFVSSSPDDFLSAAIDLFRCVRSEI